MKAKPKKRVQTSAKTTAKPKAPAQKKVVATSKPTVQSNSGGMNLEVVQELITFVAKSGVSEVSIEQKDFKITVKAVSGQTIVHASIPTPVAAAPVAPIAAAPAPQPAATPAAPAAPKVAADDTANLVTIKSPMIGTFYRSSSPDKPPLVNVGDEIKAGKAVCIIEAMKLFNEIESEVSGKIVKVLVDNASPVEYDQPLFLVEPN